MFAPHPPTFDPQAERVAYDRAVTIRSDEWVCGAVASEVPMLRDGRWVLYVFNPSTLQHGWYDFATDTTSVA